MTAAIRKPRSLKKEESWWSQYHDVARIQRDGLVTPEGIRRWKYDQRVDMHCGILPDDKVAALAELGIRPFASPAAREWSARYEAFIDEHGRTPSRIGDEVHERELARAACRYKLGHVFDTTGLENKRTIAEENLWRENFAALKRWTEAHGRLPKMRAPDPAESTMANFVNVQRRHLAADKLPEHREGLLRGIPGVLNPRPKDRDPSAWGAALEEFYVANGRLPHQTSTAYSERSLAAAVYRHGLDVPDEVKREIWWSNMDEVRRWCAANGRLPHNKSKDASEAKAAAWWGIKRSHWLPTEGMDLQAERAIGSLIMELAKTRKHPEPGSFLWREQLETLQSFYEAFGRLPRRCTDPLEHALARWVHSQRSRNALGSLPEEAARILQEAVPAVLGTRAGDQCKVNLAA